MHIGWLHHMVDWMRFIQSVGPLGWFLFIGLYALCCLLFIPASLLTVACGAVYGFWGGSILALTGNGLGSLLSLLITRYLLKDWMRHRLEKNPRLRDVERALAKDDWKLVFLTRLSPIMPFSLINYSLGLSNISPWRFLLATELGAVPAICVYVYVGTLVGNLARIGPELKEHRPLEWTIQGAGLLIVIGVTIYVTRLVNRALKRRLKTHAHP
jgi:uncharacterized membrane protein YdjX (TVP38/TMEM64 family)